jgi:hypothetical protein
MPEFTNNPVQIVQPNQQVLLNTSIGCPKGYVLHREGSGIVTLRGIVNNPTSCFARYQATFNGNIAIPNGGTVSPISVAIAIDGEPVLTSKAIFTPTAVADETPSDNNYGNVTSTAIITVPKGCCFNISVENTSVVPTTPAGSNAPAINVKNANLTVSRIS